MKWAESGFGQRFETALARTGKTQKTFCADTGINAGTLSGWKGNNEPTFGDIQKLATALDVTPCYLAFGDEFVPMDNEERDAVELLRKLKEDERATLQAFLKTTTAGREITKKPGPRTKTTVPETVAEFVASQPRLTQAEFDAMMAHVAELLARTDSVKKNKTASKRRELPLLIALAAALPFLRQLNPSLRPAGKEQSKASDPGTVERNEESDAVAAPRAAGHLMKG